MVQNSGRTCRTLLLRAVDVAELGLAGRVDASCRELRHEVFAVAAPRRGESHNPQVVGAEHRLLERALSQLDNLGATATA